MKRLPYQFYRIFAPIYKKKKLSLNIVPRAFPSKVKGKALGTRLTLPWRTRGRPVCWGGEKSENEKGDFFSPEFFSRLFGLFPAPTNSPWFSEDASHPQLDKQPQPTNRTEKPIFTILLVLEKLQAFSCKWKIDNRQLLYNHLLIKPGGYQIF